MPTTEFWETEDLSKEKEKYVNKFVDEMVNYNENKYDVKLPWLKPIEMKDNLRVSEHRLKKSKTNIQ
ncbi:hypothetical protein BLOT_002307 [Blomia tropicalis]|nr:hypothetical protein BLOT_002307 [Blomia tropicalis]